MTEEQATQIIELLKDNKNSSIMTAICVGVFVIAILLEIVYFVIKYQKVKKMLDEYYTTLDEKERERLSLYKEIKKL